MGLNRKVGLVQGLKYQGGGPMIAWVLHRISGLGILIFVGFHVIASFFMQQTGSDLATNINIIYESWAFQIVIAFFVFFHALNGLRIAIQDLWPQVQMYQREALWLQWLIFLPIYGLTVFFLVQRGLSGG
jgi:succinate dehydrogenase / fumarate reductase, cytochrome b subunit